MITHEDNYDITVIGAGFYGGMLALHLARRHPQKRVALIEQESAIMQRASLNNQARVHNGYHYPRSFSTAFRSRANMNRFANDWQEALYDKFTSVYAIARSNSKTNSTQFLRFCKEIGAHIEYAPEKVNKLFNRNIDDVFLVEEYAFNADILAKNLEKKLESSGVEIFLNTKVNNIKQTNHKKIANMHVINTTSKNTKKNITSKLTLNCTYSQINQFTSITGDKPIELKHEFTEMPLVNMPNELSNIAITVMDGPFFSIMPYPTRSAHTISHVRYTPHCEINDLPEEYTKEKIKSENNHTRYERIIRDVRRYFNGQFEPTYLDSIYEIKTVHTKNETNDGRPIVFEPSIKCNGLYNILGGKIDNVYDAIQKLNELYP